ncbi:MAG: conjugative transfer ATPase [Gammaproteobacteria bacterium]|nr:conjugative transfer ATPase [Gammaproteobacteria bacterium]MCP5135388.1 conjugative transfer ATPase [Gammaproteobacteria bacterium]
MTDPIEHATARYGAVPSTLAYRLGKLLGLYPLFGPAPPLRKHGPGTFGVTSNTPSFAARIPWRWIDPDTHQLVGTDSSRRFLCLELRQFDTEAREEEALARVVDRIKAALQTLPERAPPWTLQVYLEDVPARALIHDVRQYVEAHNGSADTGVAAAWLSLFAKHVERLSAGDGYFEDPATRLPWAARFRRLRAVLYRAPGSKRSGAASASDLEQASVRICESLSEAGIATQRMDGGELRDWLYPWFNGAEAYTFLDETPYPHEAEASGNLPAHFDLAELCLGRGPIQSDSETGTWTWGNRAWRYLPLEPSFHPPRIGHWTRSTEAGRAAPFDRLPNGSILNFSIAFLPQDQVRDDMAKVAEQAFGETAEARLTGQQYGDAQTWMARGHHMLATQVGLYIHGRDVDDLDARTVSAESAVAAAGFSTMPLDDNPLSLDYAARALPGCWDWKHDARHGKAARLTWDTHLAALLPVWGRATGSGNPGSVFWNRVGEPFTLDILNSADRRKNGHLFLFGPTGAGKTATLNYMLMQAMAVHRPRLFIITALPTFGLLAAWFERHGCTVNHVSITPDSKISLPPFAQAKRLREAADQASDEDGGDALGQMELVARLMITGGEAAEEARMSRADRALIQEAILAAARSSQRDEVLTEHVAVALSQLGENDAQRARATEMATAMRLYCEGFAGELFNRPGEAWPDVDVTIVELGALARKGYEDKLAVAMVGLMNRIHDRVEANQFDPRQTVTLVDEAHVLLKNALLAPYLTGMGAMWRTFGAWLWIATQNMRQFPESTKELLNLPEWWICLNTERDDVEQIRKFKDLTEEQTALLLSTRKEPGLYTEGVVIARAVSGLFRVVPPALALALAQTEKHEKAARAALQQEHGISELDAAIRIAEAMTQHAA